MMRLNKIMPGFGIILGIIVLAGLLTAVLSAGYRLGMKDQKAEGQRQAIERNCAQYNPKTAQFEWLSEAKLPPMTSHDMGVALKDIRVLEKASKAKTTKRQ
jgi:hypothetical protein